MSSFRKSLTPKYESTWTPDSYNNDNQELRERIRRLENATNTQTYSVGYTEKDVKQWKSQHNYMGYGTWEGTWEYKDKEIHHGSGYTEEQARAWINGGSNRWMIRE